MRVRARVHACALMARSSVTLRPSPSACTAADFLTEGGDQADAAGGGAAATAEPLGLAASVPRCLRWPERVPLAVMGADEAEALVLDIWKVGGWAEGYQPMAAMHVMKCKWPSPSHVPVIA